MYSCWALGFSGVLLSSFGFTSVLFRFRVVLMFVLMCFFCFFCVCVCVLLFAFSDSGIYYFEVQGFRVGVRTVCT